MADIVEFSGLTRLDLDPERVLDAAKGNLKSVIVIGYDENDEEYFASSISDGADVVWLLERSKLNLLKIADEIEAE